jgi:hypothetical protein
VGNFINFFNLLDDKMKKLALILMLTAGAAQAQNVTYTNQYGAPVGTAQTTGNLTTYSNQYGQVVGFAHGAVPLNTPPPMMLMPAPPLMPTAPTMPIMPIQLVR